MLLLYLKGENNPKTPLIIPYKYKIVPALLLMIAIYKALYKVKCKVIYKVVCKVLYKVKVSGKVMCTVCKTRVVGTFFDVDKIFMMYSYL